MRDSKQTEACNQPQVQCSKDVVSAAVALAGRASSPYVARDGGRRGVQRWVQAVLAEELEEGGRQRQGRVLLLFSGLGNGTLCTIRLLHSRRADFPSKKLGTERTLSVEDGRQGPPPPLREGFGLGPARDGRVQPNRTQWPVGPGDQGVPVIILLVFLYLFGAQFFLKKIFGLQISTCSS
jgi:hypothetical protein